VLVLSYRDVPTGTHSEYLSFNLIITFHISDQQGTVDSQSLLITFRRAASNVNYTWIISDGNGDGFIDGAHFIETTKEDSEDKTNTVYESDAPNDAIEHLQKLLR